ncbi:MAG: hypothetical protein AAGF11_40925 [Myxococcota bacterium]
MNSATMFRPIRAVSVLSLALGLGASIGCSLTLVDVAQCSDNADCRSAYGVASTCNDAGFCEVLTLLERCDEIVPEDLLDNPDNNDAVVFGSLVDRSVVTELGRERSVHLAVDMANRQGGLEGRTVGMISCDIQDAGSDNPFAPVKDGLSRLEAAEEVSSFLVEDLALTGLIGPSASADVELVYSEVVEPAGAVMISPAATSASLTGLDVIPATADAPGRLWRTAPDSRLLAETMAQDILDRQVGSIVVLVQQGYGEVLGADIQDALTELGANVTVTVIPWQLGGRTELQAAINMAKASLVGTEEIVFLSSYTKDAVYFIETFANDDAFDGTTAFLADAAGNWDLLRANAIDRYGVSQPADPMDPMSVDRYDVRVARYAAPQSTTYGSFVSQYKSAYRNEDPTFYNFSAQAYDATWLMLIGAAWALDRTGSLSGHDIARGLRRSNDKSGGVAFTLEQANWRGIQAQIRGGASLDVEGASGALDIDGQTEETTGVPEVLVVEKGSGDNFTFVAPPVPPSE